MNLKQKRHWLYKAAVAGLAALVWLAGVLTMQLPFGDRLMQLSYDFLNLCLSHQPDPKVVVIALSEDSDSELENPPGAPLSRELHAKLLERLKTAGVERVCYDILFEGPGPDPQADEDFAAAIKDEGNVFLGGRVKLPSNDLKSITSSDEEPFPMFAKAAKGWGVLNAGIVDPDGMVRRLHAAINGAPALAVVAAKDEGTDALMSPLETRWLYYQAMPGQIPTLNFAECLNGELASNDQLEGKTVFIGGEYKSEKYGGNAVYPTPFSHEGARAISDVEWQANAFINAAKGYWFVSAGPGYCALWCLPLAALPWFLWGRWRKRWVIVIWVGVVAALVGAAIFVMTNGPILFNWLVMPVVQFPLGLMAVGASSRLRILLARWGQDVFIS
jgi:CHASE2 domain-containing sensor protein